MSIIKAITFGIDLYDMPIKAVSSDGEVIVSTSLEDALIQFGKVSEYDINMRKYISNKKYWGDFEATQGLFRYASKMTGAKIIKPNIIISVPMDGTEGPFGDIFKRAISEAATSSGWRAAKLVENVYCAAVGAGVPVKELNNTLFVYSNSWCTYFTLIFAGAFVDAYIIQSSIDKMRPLDILNALENLISNLSVSYENFNHTNDLNMKWNSSLENKVYMSIPDSKRLEIGSWMGKYQTIYSLNYETCIVDGLAKIINYTDFDH